MSDPIQTATQPVTRKPYAKPEIIHELKLETRAGSPVGAPPLNPANPFSNKN